MATKFRDEAVDASSQFLNDAFQRGLARWNRRRLAPGFPCADWQATLAEDARMQRLEGGFVEELRLAETPAAARGACSG